MNAQHEDREPRLDPLNFPEDIEAVSAGHFKVEHYNVPVLTCYLFKNLVAVQGLAGNVNILRLGDDLF
jgi:hypothetical protein